MSENPFAAHAAARAKAEQLAQLDEADLEAVVAADDAAQEAAEVAARAEEQERQVQVAVEEYLLLAPEIDKARPLPAQTTTAEPKLTGAAWVADRVNKVLVPRDGTGITVDVRVHGRGVLATLTFPPHVGEAERLRVGKLAAARLEAQGNLGRFTVQHGADAGTVLLYRAEVEGPDAWHSHGRRAGAFVDSRDAQRTVFDEAGLVQKNPATGNPQRPLVHEFGEDERGGTAELRLPPGMTLDTVRKALPGLRQALRAPDLEVTSRGVWPVLHLNTKCVAHDFPKTNPMSPSLFARPRTMPERHVSAESFVLPLGVRADGSPILVDQAEVPHMAVFGGTGSGKTVLLTSLIDGAIVQGAEVILIDGKAGKDLRRLAFSGRNGIVAYAAGSEAVLHRAVKYAADEFARRKVMQERLQRQGEEYRPPVLLVVFDEYGSWIHDLVSAKGERAAAALETITRMEFLAAQARELKIFLLLSGQHSYVSAMTGTLRDNIKTLVVVGPPSKQHLEALFEGPKREEAKQLGAQISPRDKGRGIVADSSGDGVVKISMFQGFFNPPGPAADAMTAAVAAAPRLRRFAFRFPIGTEVGADGTWQSWTPVSEPSSDTLPVILLDGSDRLPLPGAAMFDPTSREYNPGTKPLSAVHAAAN